MDTNTSLRHKQTVITIDTDPAFNNRRGSFRFVSAITGKAVISLDGVLTYVDGVRPA